MEYWNVGILGLKELIYFYMDGHGPKIKLDPHSFLILNIPFFSPIRRLCEPEAIIPLFHEVSSSKAQPSEVKSELGSLGQGFLPTSG